MYAIVETGGKQYKIREGEMLRVEKLEGDIGDAVTFDKVLMVGRDDDVRIGTPVVDGAIVRGQIVTQGKARKIIVFKYRRRKRYRLKKGHRQMLTTLRIDAIEA